MTTTQTILTEYQDVDEAKAERNKFFAMAKKSGQLVHRHVDTDPNAKHIDYVVDVVKQRYVHRVVRKP